MTLDDFLSTFESLASKKKWWVHSTGIIISENYECPICFVDNQLNHEGKIKSDLYPYSTKTSKDLGYTTSVKIVDAADQHYCGTTNYVEDVKQLRSKLLKITGA